MVLLESENLPLGTKAFDFSLPATDGNTYSLNDFADREALVVAFICNHCPYVKAVLDRMVILQNDYFGRVAFVFISSNDARNYPDDDFAHMRDLSLGKGISYYLYDESQEVAKAYKAQCTPDIYLFDKDRCLAYHGRLDDNWQDESKVTRQDLKMALERVLSGEGVDFEQFPSMGCSIKWSR
jgi:peroxiredoxin